MRALDALHNRLNVPGFLVNSMPKAGTHLLMKAVGLFPGIARSTASVTNRLGDAFDGEPVRDPVAIGVDWPKPVPRAVLRRRLRRIGRGRFAQAHTGYSAELADELDAIGLRTLLILRDPRDVVVSHAEYLAGKPQHPLFERFRGLSGHERIMTSIVGLAGSQSTASS